MHEEGAGTRRVKKKKNRNQSAKQKIIQVLETRECGEDCGCTGMEIGVNTEREFMDETNIMIKPKMVDMGTDAAKDEQKPEVCTVEVQTNTSLSHTLRDMMWTPSGLDPIVEIDYSEDDIIEPGFLEGDGVDDIDAVDVETIESEDDSAPRVTAMIMAMMVMNMLMPEHHAEIITEIDAESVHQIDKDMFVEATDSLEIDAEPVNQIDQDEFPELTDFLDQMENSESAEKEIGAPGDEAISRSKVGQPQWRN